MKLWNRLLIIGSLVLCLASIVFTFHANAQTTAATATSTPSITVSPSPTKTQTTIPSSTPYVTPTSGSLIRPFIVLQNYSSSSSILQPGQEFTIQATFFNNGSMDAHNLTITFNRGEYLSPTSNGGVHSFASLAPNQTSSVSQPMLADNSFGGRTLVNSSVTVSYMNENGTSYEQTFTLAFAAASIQATSTAAPLPTAFGRPFVSVQNYETGIGLVEPAQAFTLNFVITNSGQLPAQNVAVTFEGNDCFPIQTTGVFNVSSLPPGAQLPITQPMVVNKELGNKSIVSTIIHITYNDQSGNSYENKFTLTFPTINVTPTFTPTITPTPKIRPQLLIFAYTSDTETLRPGDQFNLELHISNLGRMNANNVYLIIGGSGESSSSTQNTPQPEEGTNNISSDLSKFAPVNSANRLFLGNIPVQKAVKIKQKFIVNVNTDAGAQTLPFSFAYTDDEGRSIVESQSITLLVYSPLKLDIALVQPIPTLVTGEPASLSIQITNIGKKSVLLGSVEFVCEDADIENTSGIIGNLDSGGFFSADVKITPKKPGIQKLTTRIHYIDDFGKPRTIKKDLALNVQAPPTPPPIDESLLNQQEQGNFWDQVLLFLRRLFGLEPAMPQELTPPPEKPLMKMDSLNNSSFSSENAIITKAAFYPTLEQNEAAPAKYTLIAGAVLLLLFGGGGSVFLIQKRQHRKKHKRRIPTEPLL